MAAKPVVFHPEAVSEAEAALAWYENRSPRAAEMFLHELDRVVASVQAAPDRGLNYSSHTKRILLKRFPFFIVYRDTTSEVQIIAVAHGRRRPGYWRNRLSGS